MPKPPTRNPLYAQVADYVMQQIAAGTYMPHQAIPTEWQLAKKLEVDGVHLGKKDMPIDQARQILGEAFIIGGTANTFEDVLLHYRAGED